MVIYVVSLYTQCLRYNICSAWFLDIRISTFFQVLLVYQILVGSHFSELGQILLLLESF